MSLSGVLFSELLGSFQKSCEGQVNRSPATLSPPQPYTAHGQQLQKEHLTELDSLQTCASPVIGSSFTLVTVVPCHLVLLNVLTTTCIAGTVRLGEKDLRETLTKQLLPGEKQPGWLSC